MCLETAGDPDAHREGGQLTQGSSVLVCQPSCGTRAKHFAQPLPTQRRSLPAGQASCDGLMG